MLTVSSLPAVAQDNSPYSRYGLGDQVPTTNVMSRSMGGISAGYYDQLGVNYANPASYAWFQTQKEARSKKIAAGRAILDIGINYESRTLREPNNNSTAGKFNASNLLFSHVQLAVPLRPNWGLSFGIRPMYRISYNMIKRERLLDPISGTNIDSAQTLSEGDGGAYMPNIGTGFKFKTAKNQWLSLGVTAGYLFGKKDYATRRAFINDSVAYNAGNWQTKSSFGNIFFNAGLQYSVNVNSRITATFGAYGNWQQKLKATEDRIRETYYYDESAGYTRLDSVYDNRNVKGDIIYPSSYTVGFVIQKSPLVSLTEKQGGWLVGVDFSQTKWDDYRYYGKADSVRSRWELRVGGELRPAPNGNRYWSNVAYRAGFFVGPDYIHVREKLPMYGITAGLGLPLAQRLNSQARYQYTMINLGFEYIKRGNNDNLLKENLFRLSIGLSLSDLWFQKRRYD
ncbi:hypothetical protein JMG10_21905 [Nostoc ellipsosporum NOK]|nr:hypothetical protein [Nostoc ellipsosporum NOK]